LSHHQLRLHPPELLESELFGPYLRLLYRRIRPQKGKFESPTVAPVFLDEIGEMAARTCSARASAGARAPEIEIRKSGATATQKVNVRIIAATHRNLEERALAEG